MQRKLRFAIHAVARAHPSATARSFSLRVVPLRIAISRPRVLLVNPWQPLSEAPMVRAVVDNLARLDHVTEADGRVTENRCPCLSICRRVPHPRRTFAYRSGTQPFGWLVAKPALHRRCQNKSPCCSATRAFRGTIHAGNGDHCTSPQSQSWPYRFARFLRCMASR